jgi:hypothetical protein
LIGERAPDIGGLLVEDCNYGCGVGLVERFEEGAGAYGGDAPRERSGRREVAEIVGNELGGGGVGRGGEDVAVLLVIGHSGCEGVKPGDPGFREVLF